MTTPPDLHPASMPKASASNPRPGVAPSGSDAPHAGAGGPMTVLQPPVNAERKFIRYRGLRAALYLSTPPPSANTAKSPPLVLLHSINAAASAAEVKPLFNQYGQVRPVLAIELPGFGGSERRRIDYTPRLMSECIARAVAHLREFGLYQPVDLMAVSLSCELAVRAALENPTAFRSLGLISPTGFESKRPERYEDDRTKDKPWLRLLLESGPWSKALFRLLTSEKSMRKFLQRTWGERDIDEELLAYNLLTVRQPGARHAPYGFIGGSLFTRGVMHLYQQVRHPVWMIHGTRGEFANVDGLERFAPVRPWAIDSINAGAMPYFQRPLEFAQRYDSFLTQLPQA
jgi:pimeloyl-ACP methyl ester carboxylesterase